MTVVDDLARLIPPPGDPVAAAGDWGTAEAQLGTRLPSDYKELLNRFGCGAFDDIVVFTPFTPPSEGVDLLVRAHRLLGTWQGFRRDWPDQVPRALYPEPGGVLEWATTGNGDSLCWRTSGDPDTWTVVVWNAGSGSASYGVGAVEFLHGFFSGTLQVDLLGDPPPVPWFEPHRERVQLYFRLSEGDLPYEERLRILRHALHPTADRGAFDDGNGVRQDHFKAVDLDWLLTYENCYGHQIRVSTPPGQVESAARVIDDVAQAMTCRVLGSSTQQGRAI